MSDFLTRLVQRQLGNIAAIEPRVPGLYDSVADVTAVQTRGLDAASQRGVDREQKAGAMPEESSSPMMINNPAGSCDASLGTPLEAHDPLVPSRKRTRGHAFPGAAEFVVEAPENSPNIDAGQAKEEAPPRLVEQRPSDQLKAPERMNGLTAPAMLARGASLAQERVGDNTEAPVHVTIGRIEVTAVAPVPTPQRAAIPRKPAMSLDDYLARRQRREP